MKIRASIGTTNRLKLTKGKNEVDPTTAYLLLERGCSGKCIFCPQSSGERNKVSRVVWPEFELDDIVNSLIDSGFERICLQTAIYPKLEEDLAVVLKAIPDNIPVSISISPLSDIHPAKLKMAGVDRIGIPLDGATEEIAKVMKGYGEKEWEEFFDYLLEAIEIFGADRVTTHIIVGLGENDKDLALVLRSFKSLGMNVALFALTPMKGSDMEPPSMLSYRKAQVMSHLLIDLENPLEVLHFDNEGSQ